LGGIPITFYRKTFNLSMAILWPVTIRSEFFRRELLSSSLDFSTDDRPCDHTPAVSVTLDGLKELSNFLISEHDVMVWVVHIDLSRKDE
jgi:hypothetical protein